MSEELDAIEQELHALRPKELSTGTTLRLISNLEGTRAAEPMRPVVTWREVLKWIVPAVGAVAAALVATGMLWNSAPGLTGGAGGGQGLRADEVLIDRQLVLSFQTVAESPEGLPIRFELQEWRDLVTFRDTRRGVTVQRTSPRVEIVPIGYESF